MTVAARVKLPLAFAGSADDLRSRPRGFPRADAVERPVEALHGVGPTVWKKLAKLGLETVGDLLSHAPFRYEQPVDEKPIDALRIDEEAVVDVEVVRFTSRRTRRRLTVQNAVVSDGASRVTAVWFNQPWLERQLQPGTHARLRGRLQRRGEFLVKSFDVGERAATADFAPVYPASEEITPKKLRELVAHALPRSVLDPLPADVKVRERFPTRGDALWGLHRPRSLEEAEAGRRRLAFDELLLLQLGIARRRKARASEIAPALGQAGELVERYRRLLPFALTEHQQ